MQVCLYTVAKQPWRTGFNQKGLRNTPPDASIKSFEQKSSSHLYANCPKPTLIYETLQDNAYKNSTDYSCQEIVRPVIKCHDTWLWSVVFCSIVQTLHLLQPVRLQEVEEMLPIPDCWSISGLCYVLALIKLLCLLLVSNFLSMPWQNIYEIDPYNY